MNLNSLSRFLSCVILLGVTIATTAQAAYKEEWLGGKPSRPVAAAPAKPAKRAAQHPQAKVATPRKQAVRKVAHPAAASDPIAEIAARHTEQKKRVAPPKRAASRAS